MLVEMALMFAIATIAATAKVHAGHPSRTAVVTEPAASASVTNWMHCLIRVYRESIPPK